MDQRTVDRLVTPFYLKMMRTNAVSYGEELERELVAVGLDASTQDVISLLRVPWRSTVMGAWFSLLRDDDEVTAEVLRAVSRSHGSLDAPPLVTAATVLAGPDAGPALEDYAARDAAGDWQASGFAGAAIEHLGHRPANGTTDDDRADFAALFALANRLRSAR